MSRTNYQYPSEADLRPENVLSIYTMYQQEQDFEGRAVLIERQEGWRQQFPYVRIELGGTEAKNPITVNWATQRWLVRFIDGPQKGFTTHRYISYFLCIDSYLSSGVELFPSEIPRGSNEEE